MREDLTINRKVDTLQFNQLSHSCAKENVLFASGVRGQIRQIGLETTEMYLHLLVISLDTRPVLGKWNLIKRPVDVCGT